MTNEKLAEVLFHYLEVRRAMLSTGRRNSRNEDDF